MDIKSWYKNKRALSTVIATVLLILLVLVSTTIVWAFVKNIVEEKTEGTQTCFDIQSSGKVVVNDYYTCYNATSDEVQFSINIGDTEIDSLLVSILVGGDSKSFVLTNADSVVTNLRPYKGNYGDVVKLPGENEGKTYVAGGFDPTATKVDWIKIAPMIGERQCDPSDEVYQIVSCSVLQD